ncbi:cell division regulator GpsB [Leuconostoc rapi]|uniref:cell division regulator GpsB n=1 Tax=Leuconostoc rapi TaxID=1406906 RepID=UPI00195659AF|nr:cell division regulator GpsB [Leuconostoc rapi]MBM7434890.1 DivIVA domain-containing protein [Leuconostoc rapi]
MEQVKYTQKDILERVFKQKRMGVGYDPADVDSFLDDIIKDYGAYAGRVDQLQNEVARLQGALKSSQEQLVALQKQPQPIAVTAEPIVDVPEEPVVVETPKPVQAVTNLDLIKRVANLERAVFGHDASNNA